MIVIFEACAWFEIDKLEQLHKIGAKNNGLKLLNQLVSKITT